MFGLSGENLTKRLRRDAFEAMLRQEIGWHDMQENNTGALCARLSGDAGKVQGRQACSPLILQLFFGFASE